MSARTAAGLRLAILAIHEEATVTASAKGLTGTLAQLAALRETASLVSAQAGRAVGEEEVMRVVLNARRTRGRLAQSGPLVAEAASESAPDGSGASRPVVVRVRRGRLPPLALRPLLRSLAAMVR